MEQQLLLPSPALGSIVTERMTRRQARAALFKAGYKFVGGGSFASVWKSPDGTRVVKVTKPDPGSEATVRVAQQLPDNPHLPTIYGTLIPKNGGLVIETEVLLPDDGETYDEFENSDVWYDNGEGFDTPLGEALRALNRARRNDYRLDWDGHDENIMLRPDGTIVLTDLLYSPANLRQSAIYGGRKRPGGGSAHNLAAARAAANHRRTLA